MSKSLMSTAVDNHLGMLCWHVQRVRNWYPEILPKVTKSLGLKPHPEDARILVSSKTVPDELADRCRKFIFQIPFDQTIPRLNDETNPPSDRVYIASQDPEAVTYALANPITDPNEWYWVNYNGGIFRAAPKSLSSFCGSPIYELITVLLTQWFENSVLDVKNTIYDTVVVQRTPRDGYIDAHTDRHGNRKVSYVYYLSHSDLTSDDGGILTVYKHQPEKEIKYNHEDVIQIPPTFNTMVAWEMEETGLLHWVTPYTSDRERVSLVGFWSSPGA